MGSTLSGDSHITELKGGETMLESDKYAYVNTGSEGIVHLVRIKKDTPMPETDKAKLTEWANQMGFTISKRKRILHAE